MSKVIRDVELAQIVSNIVRGNLIAEKIQYRNFLEDLGILISHYCGGLVVDTSVNSGDELGYCVHFSWSEAIPEDGGVFAAFDTDVDVAEWREEVREAVPVLAIA